MKFLFTAALTAAISFAAVDVRTAKLRGGLLPGLAQTQSPAPSPDLFNVFIRSNDPMVRGFRVSMTYEYDGQRITQQRIAADTGEAQLPQAVVMFPIPDVAAKVLSLTVAELKDSSSTEITQ